MGGLVDLLLSGRGFDISVTAMGTRDASASKDPLILIFGQFLI